MKQHTLTSVLVALIALAIANVTLAQDLGGSCPNCRATNFPMVGIVRGQTLLLNLVAFPPNPCSAQLGVQDSNGKVVASTQILTLAAGQSAVLAVDGNSLTTAFGQRVELLPTVAGPDGTIPAAACVATAEVIDNFLGATMVLAPGADGYPSQPIFGMLGVTLYQTVRLNVVAFPPVPCIGQIGFADKNGNQIGTPKAVQLSSGPGQATFLDLPGSVLVSALGQRAEVRPVVTVTGGACIASAEVYNNVIRTTAVYYPPVPCAPSGASCVAF
jgi:hypothetical protein